MEERKERVARSEGERAGVYHTRNTTSFKERGKRLEGTNGRKKELRSFNVARDFSPFISYRSTLPSLPPLQLLEREVALGNPKEQSLH